MEYFRAMNPIKLLTHLVLAAAMAVALLTPVVFASSISDGDCASLSESLAGALGCDTSDQVSDFTEYTGRLEAPDDTGYDAALTQTDNARDFIQTIVNYALSFLGLIATVIIIYGGIMYVMSRGDEDMASKGKKSIGYAVVGIVIILGSFALVNTLLDAGGGGSSSISGGAEGTTITETGAAFDVQSVLSEIEEVTGEYLDAYDTFLAVSETVGALQATDMPLIIYVSIAEYNASGLLEALVEWATRTDDTYTDKYQLLDKKAIQTYLQKISTGLNSIQSIVDPLSDTYESSQELYNYLTGGAYSADPSNSASTDCAYEDLNSSDTYRGLIELGYTSTSTESSVLDTKICGYLNDVLTANVSDYEEQVGELIVRFQEMEDLFVTEGFTSGSSLTKVNEAYQSALSALEKARTSTSANNQNIRLITSTMNDFYVAVEDIEFVRVRLEASVIKGNAPLIVRFNALGTEDPSGKTVTDNQIQWDLDGDFSYDSRLSGDVVAEDINGAAVSAMYAKPGTYRVRLRVLSSDSNIAAGVASVTIQVEPPKSTIYLTAIAGGETTLLADYSTVDARGKYKVPVDVMNYKVTMTEALEGINFDASQTKDGDGNSGSSGGIVYYEWDFGDNDTTSGTYSEAAKVSHKYGEEGDFNVSLTVTDDTGVKDRKYFKLYVASPAARMSYSPTSGTVGTTFALDATGSSTDIGSIVNYQWSAEKNGIAVKLDDSAGNTISATFNEPGVYKVNLKIADSSGSTDTASVDLLVESTPPVATYTYDIPNANQPNVVVFDAKDSYDSDKGDTLTYEWDIDAVEEKDYKILNKAEGGKELTVQFLESDEYEVTLTVYDQHEGNLKKSDTAVGTIVIDSVLDVELSVQGSEARHLDGEGMAEVEFKAVSSTATAFEIDYGDDHSDFTETIVSGQSIFTHEYEQAGVFYVTLRALDDDGNSNSITRRVYVGGGDAPIAVVSVTADGEDIGFGDTLTGNIKTKFGFDARDSINLDGTGDTLEYSWNFGDGVTSSQAAVTHIFEETATFTVTLAVRDKSDKSLTDETTVQIAIEGIVPEIQGLTVIPQGDSLETPLKVNVTVNAVDEDGKITYVKAWYYDLNDTATELGTVIAQTTSFTLTVNTKGTTGQVVEYGFAAEVKDNDNNTVSSFDELDASSIPTLEVTNGSNETPVVGFTVDKTSVHVGEEITFSSTSYDPDGDIVSYWWDMEGDGFYNNKAQESSSYTYFFTQVHSEGVSVQLKVEDSSGATATSDKLTIYVDSIAAPPDAAFLADVNGKEVTFRNNSTLDTDNGAELSGIYWDFDLFTDSNGNGTSDDDFDSFDENPVHTYEELGTYQVKMTIVDNSGQIDSVSQEISVIETSDPVAAFTYTVEDRSVVFKNKSTVDKDNEVEIRSYSWDFDLSMDTDGDTDPENDVDATTKNPSFEYEDYDDYDVKLTVVDSFGKTDTLVETITVPNPVQPVTALLTSTPQPNGIDQVILSGDGQKVTFYYGAEGGSGNFDFQLDKNIFYDSNKDGLRDNDIDFQDNSSGAWKTPFYMSYGQIVVKLTVIDEETGEKDIATLQVVFEGNPLGANLFNVTPNEMIFLILSAILAAIAGITLVFRNQMMKSNLH